MTPEALARLHAVCFATPRPWSAAEFKELLADPVVFCLGAANAFALGRVVADQAELLTIAVHPDARRKGYARQLISRFHVHAQERGATESFLDVAADNAPARALYLGEGYKEVGRRSAYYRKPTGQRVDALTFLRQF